MKDNTYLNKSRDCLSNGRIQDCINLMKENVNDEDILNQILQLEIRYNTLQRRITNGTIDLNDAQLEENRISNPLLMIISNLAKGKKDFIPNTQTKKQIDFKLTIIGILGLFLLGLGLYVIINSNNSELSLCEAINCENNGECVNGKCKCPEGFSGKNCQIKNSVPDPEPPPQSTLKPDLKITAFQMNPEIPTEGEIVYMEAIVKNLGSKESKRFKIKWWASIDDLQPAYEKEINNLSAGEQNIFRFEYAGYPISYSIVTSKLEIDKENLIQESDENNNLLTRSYQVKELTEIIDTRDNNKYKVKKIGDTYWLMDNMRYEISGSKCENCESNGRHYNLEMAKKACPEGWSLPSINDFNELKKIGVNFKGVIQLADIEFNGMFTSPPRGGYVFSGVGKLATFWTSSSQGGYFNYDKQNNKEYFSSDRLNPIQRLQMFSCRCIKEE